VNAEARPAFYALAPGSWRDYVTLLHPPYTVWHLSYVVIGAALAPDWRPWRLVATLAAFLFGLGVGAHALDELNGRPLATRIPDHVLVGLAVASITAAVGIGIGGAVVFDLWLLVFVVAGAFIVCAYNVELFGGRFHSDLWFALAWGAFPLVTGYFAAAGRIRGDAVLAAAFAALTSYAQRLLSTPVRKARRRVASVSGALVLKDGTSEAITRQTLTAANEAALRALSGAMVSLAVALVVLRVAE
jgi:hypothetical protein